MKKRYPVKVKKSLIENLRIVIPMIFDDFISYKEAVVNHPRRKDTLHEMRITGKPIRYIMELILHQSNPVFKKCFEEIKYAVELLGEIHDCDVFVAELNSHLREVRQYNNRLIDRPQRIPTGSVINLIRELREKRAGLFDEVCAIFGRWERERFKNKLTHSIHIANQNMKLVNAHIRA